MTIAQNQGPVNSAGSGKLAQQSRILNHLLSRGPVTAVMMTELYGIGSPRKRLSELRSSPRLAELGCELRTQKMDGINRYGEHIRYNLYYLYWLDEEGDHNAV